eukprot:TRINITY_DN8040_c0_g1_i1.p1 TRINITY_DN8040_c0_g1~~TRINITY_DN8040_c0_g1_i1.p1  ORF type:complete len:139 (-),score=43.29 TRINITY_DN8040_c0_g1_i1:86-454(-)
MGKSLNYIGKKCGKREQLQSAKLVKLQKKEEYKKFYDSYPVEKTPADWRCSACDEYYYHACEDEEVHEKEWGERARESARDDIAREYKKIGMGGETKNRVGYKIARKCYQDDYFGDFILAMK